MVELLIIEKRVCVGIICSICKRGVWTKFLLAGITKQRHATTGVAFYAKEFWAAFGAFVADYK
jgi:hypothetical protein